MSARDVWVSKDDSSDIVRAESIAGVGRDYNGNVTPGWPAVRGRP